MKKIYIGSDHAGFAIKEKIKKALGIQYQFVDLGPNGDGASVDYPVYAQKVGEAVAADPDSQGVVVCGSGIGVTIVANKVPGIRAAMGYSVNAAKLSRQHNNANVIATAGREETMNDPVDIVSAFLSTPFSNEERHARRVKEIGEIERKYSK